MYKYVANGHWALKEFLTQNKNVEILNIELLWTLFKVAERN